MNRAMCRWGMLRARLPGWKSGDCWLAPEEARGFGQEVRRQDYRRKDVKGFELCRRPWDYCQMLDARASKWIEAYGIRACADEDCKS